MPQRKTRTPANRALELLRPSGRFFRSVNLERDFTDSRSLDGYVVTPQIREYLTTILDSLRADSARRAWRVTGDYGSGKSLFALALAKALSFGTAPPDSVLKSLGVPRTNRQIMYPVLVTGSRAALAPSLLAAVHAAATAPQARHKLKRVAERTAKLGRGTPTDTEIAGLIAEFATAVRSSGLGNGLLVVIDELGRFLEFSAMNPHLQDIGLYQLLAETAARSGSAPVLLVGLLHEGFAAYANHLSTTAQREWEKVSGRFDELVFSHPLEQTALLAAEALGVRTDNLPASTRQQARSAMLTAVEQGWFGSSSSKASLAELAPRLFPLHPTVLPVAATLFSRYGQNERSLFSFLVSQDPFGIQAFGSSRSGRTAFYRLPDFYDYARAAFGKRLGQSGYRSHWPVIESTVESYPAGNPSEVAVLKSAAMMNLATCGTVIATPESLELAVAGWSDAERDDTLRAVTDLRDKRRVLYSRGARAGLCLWPNTSVDLDHCHQLAVQAVPSVDRTVPFLVEELQPGPIVARRHYIQTGNMRHFAVSILDARSLSSELFKPDARTDGQVFVVLCETAADHASTSELLRGPMKSSLPPNWLVGMSAPVAQLQGLVTELRRWEWVVQNVQELKQDKYAREEAERQLATARRLLRNRMSAFVDLGISGSGSSLEWFHEGRCIGRKSGREFLALVSIACDKTFSLAPRVRNELINRRRPSSAASAARLRLIERLIETPDQPMLGLDAVLRPPETSMYLSVLKAGGLHQHTRRGWSIQIPTAKREDPLNLRPTFDRIMSSLTEVPDARVSVGGLLRTLYAPPYGVREGLAPLLLAVCVAAHEDMVAIYEHGSFLPTVSAPDFQRLVKAPETFEIQFCQITGVRRRVFRQLLTILVPEAADATETDDVLAVVRPLCEFAAQLPAVVRRTTRLSSRAIAVRDALLDAREPMPLVFTHLPAACGLKPLTSSHLGGSDAGEYVTRLKLTLDELRSAFPKLVAELAEAIARAFGYSSSLEAWRPRLTAASEHLLFSVTDPGLRVLCLRLTDKTASNDSWVTAIASQVTGKPVPKWEDTDYRHFISEITRWSAQFRRVEAASDGSASTPEARISITFPDGRDLQRIAAISDADNPDIDRFMSEVRPLFAVNESAAVVAIARLLWERLGTSQKTNVS